MTAPTPAHLAPPATGGALIWGLLLGVGAVVGLYFVPAEWRAPLPLPLQDLFFEPALLGQGVFLAMLLILLPGEWFGLGSVRRQVDELSAGDQKATAATAEGGESASWAVRTWRLSFQVPQVRLNPDSRKKTLQKCERDLDRGLDSRWRLYFILSVLPAFLGWLVGELGLRQRQSTAPVQHIEEYFTPLWVGTGEGVLLLLLVLLVRLRGSAVIQAWGRKIRELEKLDTAPVKVPIAAEPPPDGLVAGGPEGQPPPLPPERKPPPPTEEETFGWR